MNTYPKFLEALSLADVDVPAVTWSIAAVVGAYDATDDFLNDVTVVGADGTIPGVAVSVITGGVGYATTAVSEATCITLTGINDNDVIDAFVIFIDTGTASTSRLAAYIDRRAGLSPVAFTSDGGDLKVWFPGGYFMGGNG